MAHPRRSRLRRVRQGGLGVLLVAVVATCLGMLVAPVRPEVATAGAVVRVTPVLPPMGGFSVASGQMDQALADLVSATTGRSVRAASGGGRDHVQTSSDASLAVRSGAVVVDGRGGPGLVALDVRRAHRSACGGDPACTRSAGTSTSPAVVVVRDGVEVRARAWSGLGPSRPQTLATPVLSRDELLRLADVVVWR